MKDIEEKARALFERSVQQLDEASVRRLRLARRSALAAAPATAPRWRAWPAAVAAAALLALGLGWWLPQQKPSAAPVASTRTPAPLPVSADEPVLAADDEDADLYAWLGEAPVAADDAEQRL